MNIIKLATELAHNRLEDHIVRDFDEWYDYFLTKINEAKKSTTFFPITSIHRDDLESLGFDTTSITNATMERLASKMNDDYKEQMYWLSMEIITEESFNIPKIKKKK